MLIPEGELRIRKLTYENRTDKITSRNKLVLQFNWQTEGEQVN